MKSFFSSPPLSVRVGSDAFNTSTLAAALSNAASKDAADAAARKSETDSQIKKYGAALAPFTGGGSLILAGVAIESLEAMGAVYNLINGDPNSKDWQDRAVNAYAGALDRGWVPHRFDGAVSFAKDYALYIESGNRSFDTYVPSNYRTAFRANIANPLVASAAVRAQGAWDGAFFCNEVYAKRVLQSSTQQTVGASTYLPLPMFLAALASVSRGLNLQDAIRTAYDRYLLPGTCSGSGQEAWVYHRDLWSVNFGFSSASPGGASSSGGVGIGTVAVVGGGGYLAYKFAWPFLKRKFFQ